MNKEEIKILEILLEKWSNVQDNCEYHKLRGYCDYPGYNYCKECHVLKCPCPSIDLKKQKKEKNELV
jgi:hypothetical protein